MLPFSRGALLLAPMVGITNRAFRTLLTELGSPDYAFTEMASAEAFVANAQFEEYYTDPRPLAQATSIQFFARSATVIGKACAKIASRSAETRPGGIDINFGCSAPHIRKAGGGSAWNLNPQGAAELVFQARQEWDGALSAKIRTGPSDDYEKLLAFASCLVESGLDFISFHPRMDGQKFRRKPRYDLLGRLAGNCRIPIVANGDIKDSKGILELMHTHGAYATMIGREAIRQPWIFAQIRAEMNESIPRAPVDRHAIALRYIDLVEKMLPPPWHLESCRRFFTYYCETFSFAHHLQYRLIHAISLDAMRQELFEYFLQVPADRHFHQQNIERI
jgi:tRNA-dihydrouridine synthase